MDRIDSRQLLAYFDMESGRRDLMFLVMRSEAIDSPMIVINNERNQIVFIVHRSFDSNKLATLPCPTIDDHSNGKGIRFVFKNGYQYSIQMSEYHYCEHRDFNSVNFEKWNTVPPLWMSRNAETAIINAEGNFMHIDGDGDVVQGWNEAEHVLEMAIFLAHFEAGEIIPGLTEQERAW